MSAVAKRIVFKGQVQGVGFRFTALNIAGQYQLTGYVRNAPDGTVEMLVQGPAGDIDGCISDIKDSFHGYVQETSVEDAVFDAKYKDFRITF